jgi:putative acetyltransferase
MIIRPETSSDIEAIAKIHIAAFANHPYSRQTEHLIVNVLRENHALAVSLVAEEKGEIVGHIAFSLIQIDGRACPWYILGPVGVRPDRQRQGIGQALVREGLQALRQLGAEGCVLVGDPAFYKRFGFVPNPALVHGDVPPQFCLCLPLSDRVPPGRVIYHTAFSTTADVRQG